MVQGLFSLQLFHLQVIKLISQVIADFASGEISQQEYQFDTDITLQQYLDKSFYKTATLIAASCKSAAAFSDVPVEVLHSMPVPSLAAGKMGACFES